MNYLILLFLFIIRFIIRFIYNFILKIEFKIKIKIKFVNISLNSNCIIILQHMDWFVEYGDFLDH